MPEIYLINVENPKDIALELQQNSPENIYTVLKSKTTEAILSEINELKKGNCFCNDFKLFKNFIYKKTFEPNKLSNQEIEDLCLEFYDNFIASNPRIYKNYPKQPKVNIIEDLYYWHSPDWSNSSEGYKQIFNNLVKKLDKELALPDGYLTPFVDPLNIKNGYYGALINRNQNLGGIIQYSIENSRIYKMYFCQQKLSSKNQKFWNWYQKTFDVIAIYYTLTTNTIHVIKKPDKWVFEDDYTKMYYQYGNKEKFFFGLLEVPKWLYVTPAEALNPQDYLSLNNADVKTEFIKKAGIDKLVKYGKVIDTYENYPDNEMWAKSEYKIIDMHELLPPQRVVDLRGLYIRTDPPRTYAPFLYMKNQTTGVYHLEGIHPRCTTLYDALKMRYRGLNITNFDIKDIK